MIARTTIFRGFAGRLRRAPLALIPIVVALSAGPAVRAGDPSVVSCYDSARKLVTHVLPQLCQGEIIDEAREAQLAAERMRHIRSSVQAPNEDPVTGTRQLIGVGSGFYVTAAGDLLTNSHVVDRCEMVTATPDDGKKLPATVVAAATEVELKEKRKPDIALLRTGKPAPGVAAFSTIPERSDGTRLSVVGYPAYGLPTRLSTLSRAQIDSRQLATQGGRIDFQGVIRHGSSGSPLLDQSGNVLGIVYAMPDTQKIFAKTGRLVTDIGIAVSLSATLRFLADNAITPILVNAETPALSPEALHEKSRPFVVQIGCWK